MEWLGRLLIENESKRHSKGCVSVENRKDFTDITTQKLLDPQKPFTLT